MVKRIWKKPNPKNNLTRTPTRAFLKAEETGCLPVPPPGSPDEPDRHSVLTRRASKGLIEESLCP